MKRFYSNYIFGKFEEPGTPHGRRWSRQRDSMETVDPTRPDSARGGPPAGWTTRR